MTRSYSWYQTMRDTMICNCFYNNTTQPSKPNYTRIRKDGGCCGGGALSARQEGWMELSKINARMKCPVIICMLTNCILSGQTSHSRGGAHFGTGEVSSRNWVSVSVFCDLVSVIPKPCLFLPEKSLLPIPSTPTPNIRQA